MNHDESYAHQGSSWLRRFIRRVILTLSLVFVLWLLLANHIIVVPDDPAFVLLKKTSWTFDSSIIGESSWAAFSLHHPILMTRLASGQGFWIIGGEE